MNEFWLSSRLWIIAALLVPLSVGSSPVSANDWPSWRGPEQTGMSRENAPIRSWSQAGENLVWKTSVRGRTTPIVMDGRVYAITPVGEQDDHSLAERVICMDAKTGETIWEYRFNVFHTDIVEARLGWTSVVGDPKTGHIYAHGTGGEFFCLDRDGELQWEHSLGEEFGRYSGYGGRLHTPIIDGDNVIISYVYILSNWGVGKNKSGHRYVAFDKRTGEVKWWSQPGSKPHDTTYSTPVIAVIEGRRMLIGGNADGNVYGMLAETGEKVWSFQLSKRGLNTSVVVDGHRVYATHSEENLNTTDMGTVVCIDARGKGDITTSGEIWRRDGLAVGYSSPALADDRLYVVTNSANMHCLDARTGETKWTHEIGRVMKGSPIVTADGVVYTATVNGRFLILQDHGDRVEELDVEQFTRPDNLIVEINGSPALANGRVYFQTTDDMWCIGKKDAGTVSASLPEAAEELEMIPEKPGSIMISPMDVTLNPGQKQKFQVTLRDVNGKPIALPDIEYSLEGVNGKVTGKGVFSASSDKAYSAGELLAKFHAYESRARIRVCPTLPIEESFDGMKTGTQPPGWIGLDLKTELIDMDGNVVLQKKAESPSAPYARMRAFAGPVIPAGYTVEADMIARPNEGRIASLSDMGLINDRYKFIMLGYEKRLRLVSWAPIPRIQEEVPFDWKPETWYRAKLRVDVEDGKAKVKAKVWPRDSSEPGDWMIEMVDPYPNEEGSPGLYAYSKGTTAKRKGSPVFFDNFQVYANE